MLWIRTLLFIIICGVCVAVALTVNGGVGGTVELPSVLGSLKVEDFRFLTWHFNGKIIAEILHGRTEVNLHAQFKGRLQLSPDFSLTVRELRLEDSGEYQRAGVKKDDSQIPTYKIQLHVYENITVVHIQPKVTWLRMNHTCMVRLVCSSSGNPEPSFSWRKGMYTENSKEMHFFISPEEDDISITCTADNVVSQKSSSVTIRCSPTASGVDREESTMYCTVNEGNERQIHQSESHSSPVTLYETIGELNIKAETVYDRVDLNRSCAPAPSPLKKVL